MLPQIDNQTSSNPCRRTMMILRAMFSGYTRLVLKHDFSAMGYSGSWVYLIHPFKESGGHELPVVVKVASISLIEKEWHAYKHYIRRNLLGIADLHDDPTVLEEQKLAGLCYQLIGGNIFKPQSLHKYWLSPHVSKNDIHFVLNQRLFQMIKRRVIYPSLTQFDYPLQVVYDMVLPVNLLLIPEAIPANETFTSISPTQLPKTLLEEGAYVRLEGFVVKKIDLHDKIIALNLPSGQSSHSYSVRIQSIKGLEITRFNQVLPDFEGVIVETARNRFAAEVAKIGINDSMSTMITLPDGCQEANPLLMIPQILSKTRHLKFNTIHGDLNLENILIDPAIRDISLIDFSEACYGYVLHDLLHLEMEVITKLLPDAFSKAHLRPEYVITFYQTLDHVILNLGDQAPLKSLPAPLEKPFMMLKEIRLVAREGLYDRQDFSEYYDELLLYLLGPMRFGNLDHDWPKSSTDSMLLNPKKLVFYAATAIHKLMNTSQVFDIETRLKEIEIMEGISIWFANEEEDQDIGNRLSRIASELTELNTPVPTLKEEPTGWDEMFLQLDTLISIDDNSGNNSHDNSDGSNSIKIRPLSETVFDRCNSAVEAQLSARTDEGTETLQKIGRLFRDWRLQSRGYRHVLAGKLGMDPDGLLCLEMGIMTPEDITEPQLQGLITMLAGSKQSKAFQEVVQRYLTMMAQTPK